MLGLRFCARAFSSCGKRGPLFIAVRGPLTIVASLVAEHRLQMCRLSSCGSWAQLLCGMWDLPRPGNPCPLHWQADSQPLRHQGSPHIFFIHSSVDGHLGWFHVLAIVNSAAMNIVVHVFLKKKKIIYLAALGLSCGMRDLVP